MSSAWQAAPPAVPALVVGTVAHTRHRPTKHAFRYRAYQWLVDIDDLPRYRWPLRLVTGFRARDHLDRGRLGGGIRGDVDRFLANRGVDLAADDRVLMLANARVLGHVFDPLTVFYVFSAAGQVRAVIFEVHNTFGERHGYLLHPDERGRSRFPKAFHVSPFNDDTGEYRSQLRLDGDRVVCTVALDRGGERVLTAVTEGAPRAATPGAVARTALRHGPMTYLVSFFIYLHGARLWRKLPVFRRRPHSAEAVR